MPQDKIRVSRHARTENRLARVSRWVINPLTNSKEFLQMPGDRFSGLVINGADKVTLKVDVYTVTLSPHLYSASLEKILRGKVLVSAQGNLKTNPLRTEWLRFAVAVEGIEIPTMPRDVIVEITVKNAEIETQLAQTVVFELLDDYVINFRIARAKRSSGRS